MEPQSFFENRPGIGPLPTRPGTPWNIGVVDPEKRVYRGGAPAHRRVDPRRALQFLRDEGVRTIVILNGTEQGVSVEEELEVIEDVGLDHVLFNWDEMVRQRSNGGDEPLWSELRDLFERGDLFVHCIWGVDRTGCTVARARMELYGWSREDAFREMQAYGFAFGHSRDTLQEHHYEMLGYIGVAVSDYAPLEPGHPDHENCTVRTETAVGNAGAAARAQAGHGVRIQDIIDYAESFVEWPLNKDEGMRRGDVSAEVKAVTLCWMATADVLRDAGERGDDFVICHESLYFPYNASVIPNPPADWKDWPVNRGRRELLEKHDMNVLRLHGTLDQICIFDVFAELLELGPPVSENGLAKVFEIEPCSFRDLLERVRRCMGLKDVRYACPEHMPAQIRRIGLPWGGLGLDSNVGYQQRLVAQQCDAFIAGEADAYGFRFAVESGIPMIETGHAISEEPGIEEFAGMLARRFPELRVTFATNGPSWKTAVQGNQV